ncbi:hypothetical protein Tco_0893940 [Tanacetum coccineum]|uniref:Uncharacterized protein n=1 Tax=Tanacetum coccineum TaxID=301880 RepID=A0ABQ5CD31_9ASTR
MSYLVASSTLDSARTYVMQGAPFTQGTIPSIPIGSSISPKGFLLLVLLLVVIIVMVVIVIVILIVVVDDCFPANITTPPLSPSPSSNTVHTRPNPSPPDYPTPHMVNEQAGNPKCINWTRISTVMMKGW